MNPVNQQRSVFDVGALIEELLVLNAAALLSKESGGYGALAGLGRVLRRGLELALTVGERRDVELHLVTDAQARAQGWPDASTGNLGLLIAWGWLLGYRRRRNLAAATLTGSRGRPVDRPARIDQRLCAMSIDELVVSLLATPDAVASGCVPALEAACPISIAERVRTSLKLDPASFSFDPANDEPSRIDDQDARARRCLEWLTVDVLEQFTDMRRASSRAVRTARQERAIAIRVKNGSAALVATVLAAALDASARCEVVLTGDTQQVE